VSGYFLPRHQARFQSSFPGVTVELFEAPRDVLERALVDGAIDIAVMLVSNLNDSERLAHETLLKSPRRLWMTPNHALVRAERVTLADIANYPYVMLTVDEAKHTSMKYWRLAASEPRIIFNTSSVEAVRSMVAGGMGICILSDLIYRPWSLEGQRIETRVVEGDVPSMDVGLAWRREGLLSACTEAFREFMRFAVAGVGPGRHAAARDARRRAEHDID
jgi:DNA-binding transcriptional LysR family regulator